MLKILERGQGFKILGKYLRHQPDKIGGVGEVHSLVIVGWQRLESTKFLLLGLIREE